jgi:hypothetical protein
MPEDGVESSDGGRDAVVKEAHFPTAEAWVNLGAPGPLPLRFAAASAATWTQGDLISIHPTFHLTVAIAGVQSAQIHDTPSSPPSTASSRSHSTSLAPSLQAHQTCQTAAALSLAQANTPTRECTPALLVCCD